MAWRLAGNLTGSQKLSETFAAEVVLVLDAQKVAGAFERAMSDGELDSAVGCAERDELVDEIRALFLFLRQNFFEKAAADEAAHRVRDQINLVAAGLRDYVEDEGMQSPGRFLNGQAMAAGAIVKGARSIVVIAEDPYSAQRTGETRGCLPGTRECVAITVVGGEPEKGTFESEETGAAILIHTEMRGAQVEPVERVVDGCFNLRLRHRVPANVHNRAESITGHPAVIAGRLRGRKRPGDNSFRCVIWG